ncbi:MAG TPA: hypothetical protein VKH35_12620, partial [Thermoanaerobaculia bacterium]|nr:hypothetical protein [Thermoanaerobaculia bacterium]
MVVLRRLGLALLLSAVSLRVPAQSILTIAGGGSVDGQLVSDIPTLGPQGIAFDHRGDVYLALYYAGQVLKIDATTRTVKVVAGNGASGFSGDGGPATAATLRQPAGIILDANDNLYIADTGNNRVRRVDANSGIIETLAGGGTPADGIGDGGPATAAIVGRPWGVAVFGGSLYITEQNFDANRVRRVNLAAGVIDTVAGSTDGSRGGFAGDGGPAKDAQLDTPYGIVVDAEGNLFVADSGNNRVRRIDANGVITTYAGGGATGTFDDGIPATQADLSTVTALSIAKDGSLLLASFPRVRRIDKATGVITTIVPYAGLLYGLATAADGTIYFDDGGVFTLAPGATDPVQFAGSGNYVGDGKPAKAAILHSPQGLALDHSGNLYIADSAGNIVRRVSAADGTMTTVAGTVGAFYSQEQEGADATKAVVGFPVDVAFDGAGNLYVADQLNQRIWRIDPAGKITTDAGGGSPADGVGDGGAATAANFVPVAIAFDAAGNLYIADTDPYSTPPHARVRKVDAATKVITTVAGSANLGYAGDGGPATAAHLQQPFGVAVDDDGSLLISDYGNGAIRRVDRAGIISTIAGSPDRSAGDPLGDEGPASAARLSPLHLTVDRATGDILVADGSSHRVRRIDPAGIIHTVAGSDNFYYEGGFSGDNGRATEAKLSFDYGDLSGVAVAANGDLYLSDSQNNRVRAVFACVPVAAPSITNVPDGAASPTLEWSPVAGAFRYDVRLDIVTPPVRVIASDLTETSFAPANLAPGTTYFWNVTAKGDPFCAAVSAASSAVSSFTTAAGCSAGAFDLIAPADGAAGSIAALSWQPAAGAGTYDLHLGSTNPPPLFESGLTATTHAVPDIPGLVYWFVVAHAACDPAKTSNTPIRAYTASAAPLCGAVPVVTAIAPGAGAADVPTTTTLRWSVSQISAPIDVYFGTVSDPPLFQSGLPASTTSISLPPLDPGTTYFWRVVAGCASPLSTPAVSFTTRAGCTAPQGVQILFAPSSVSAGATYAIVWSAADGLDLGGGYLVERSTSPSFATILDSQVAGSTAASFVAGAPGTYYHRVRAVPGCDPSRSGPVSANAGVRVVDAPANIIVTVPPEAVVTALGEK